MMMKRKFSFFAGGGGGREKGGYHFSLRLLRLQKASPSSQINRFGQRTRGGQRHLSWFFSCSFSGTNDFLQRLPNARILSFFSENNNEKGEGFGTIILSFFFLFDAENDWNLFSTKLEGFFQR